jgi:hypothetical protein
MFSAGFEGRVDAAMREAGFEIGTNDPRVERDFSNRPNIFYRCYVTSGGFEYPVVISTRDIEQQGEEQRIARLVKVATKAITFR